MNRLARIFKLTARCHYLGTFAGIGCFSARGGIFRDWASVVHNGSHVDVLVKNRRPRYGQRDSQSWASHAKTQLEQKMLWLIFKRVVVLASLSTDGGVWEEGRSEM